MMKNSLAEIIPFEIIEKILLDVPAHYLAFNKPWVCKSWTEVLLQPRFWIRKLGKINIIIDEKKESLLVDFDCKIQVACLYHTCLFEEHLLLKTPMNGVVLGTITKWKYAVNGRMWEITDDYNVIILAAGILISNKPRRNVLLNFHKEIVPGLPLLLRLLANTKANISVIDEYSFWNFSPRYEYFTMLESGFESRNIKNMTGCITELNSMSFQLENMMLSVAADVNNKAIIPSFPPNVLSVIYLKAGTDVSALANVSDLPDVLNTSYTQPDYSLIVSGLEYIHISWMIDTMKRLGCYPPNNLILIDYTLDKESSKQLFHSMSDQGVVPGRLMCSSSTITDDDSHEFNGLATELWPDKLYTDRLIQPHWFICVKNKEDLKDHKYVIEIMFGQY